MLTGALGRADFLQKLLRRVHTERLTFAWSQSEASSPSLWEVDLVAIRQIEEGEAWNIVVPSKLSERFLTLRRDAGGPGSGAGAEPCAHSRRRGAFSLGW